MALLGFAIAAFTSPSYAESDSEQQDAAAAHEALMEVNARFKNVEVQIITWPDELRKNLGNLKELAFITIPENSPSGKLPLVIALHDGGGKTMSLATQPSRSSTVKGLSYQPTPRIVHECTRRPDIGTIEFPINKLLIQGSAEDASGC